jgi:hypothetical protein
MRAARCRRTYSATPQQKQQANAVATLLTIQPESPRRVPARFSRGRSCLSCCPWPCSCSCEHNVRCQHKTSTRSRYRMDGGVAALLGLTAVADQHNALHSPVLSSHKGSSHCWCCSTQRASPNPTKHGSRYRMDGSVADTTCYTQDVDRQKVKPIDEFHETARITANRYALKRCTPSAGARLCGAIVLIVLIGCSATQGTRSRFGTTF